ncbi:uncharacterized protein LOC123534079 [Mercenaria mercenaria]|uniref:uncharacterized protein LOC123534079 n=1 Tax=Mercenaria mercenaria TaxID=6596 RepID=UPI00234F503F|nr:uncharacterized protein LOC123534079 [Mercenaria mercenaria]
MAKQIFLIFFLFCCVSFKFLTKFAVKPEKELIDALGSFSSVECPAGITLYRLKSGSVLYRIQVQNKLPHNIFEKTSLLRKCEKLPISGDDSGRTKILQYERYELGQGEFDKSIGYYNDVNPDTSYLLKETCDISETEPDGLGSFLDGETPNSVMSNPFLTYLLQVVKGPEPATLSNFKNNTEAWSYNTLASGIFPGTLWCGFGNMAEDMYGQVGEHSETDDCCRSHDLCKPMIKAFETRYYYSNPSVLPISHCGCDNQFYKCLLRVNSPTSKMIGKIFFNLVKMKCFDFDIRDVCVSSFLGLCREREEKCVAVLKSSKLFPT